MPLDTKREYLHVENLHKSYGHLEVIKGVSLATPTWGGPPVAEVFDLLHGLAGIEFVGVDINTLSPSHDVAGMSAMLAGHTAVIGLHLVQIGMGITEARA